MLRVFARIDEDADPPPPTPSPLCALCPPPSIRHRICEIGTHPPGPFRCIQYYVHRARAHHPQWILLDISPRPCATFTGI